MKVLVADDDPSTRLLLSALLRKWGYDVVVVEDGEAAWRELLTDAIRIVVADWEMPGIEGPDLCRRIREQIRGPYVYCILLTLSSDPQSVARGLDSGADDFLSKPFNPVELKARLEVGRRLLSQMSDGQTSDGSFGKYRLIAELGHGGMADVSLAVQAGPRGSGFTRLTVIKRVRKNLSEDPEFVSMLVDEARIAARLNHPNVVQILEAGEVDGQYFIAMEYLEGQALHLIRHRSVLRAKAGTPSLLTKEQQYLVVMDALAGLHHAHELADYNGRPLGIVHRDVAPHNILVTYEGQVKVVDFGIAKASGRSTETVTGVIKGKVRYMAPEQARGGDVDRRADIFSTGVILWEAATGQRMWGSSENLTLLQDLISGEFPASPRSVDATVPKEIDAICRCALSMDPDDRYQTAGEFRSDLERYLADAGLLGTARRNLGPAVADLFPDKRTELRRIIEQELSEQLRLSPATPADPVAVTVAPVAAAPVEVAPAAVVEAPFASADATATAVDTDSEAATAVDTNGEAAARAAKDTVRGTQRRRRAAIVGGAVALAVVLGVLTTWRVSARHRPETPPAGTSEVKEMVALHLSSNAPRAIVRVDDGPPHLLPFNTKVVRDTNSHRLVFEADGFVAKTEMVSFKQEVFMHVELVQAGPDSSAPKAPPGASSAPGKRGVPPKKK